jgi:hypothetical protein
MKLFLLNLLLFKIFVEFFYYQEGYKFLIVKTLIQLEYTIDKLISNLTYNPAAPNVSNVLVTFPLLNHADRQSLLGETTAKAKYTLLKVEHDFTPNQR